MAHGNQLWEVPPVPPRGTYSTPPTHHEYVVPTTLGTYVGTA